MEFKTNKQAADEWCITSRRVQILCNEDRIDGATKLGVNWLIPKDAKQPNKLKTGPKSNESIDNKK
ncbi:hypothetical protein AN1V17_08240 [Vallitalea sediminicola]